MLRGNSMATRGALRYISRRFSSGSGKILSEEERAAENIYIKKMEQEKLEKLARKGPKPEVTKAASSEGSGSVTDAKPSGEKVSTPGVSTDKYRNYGVVAGIVTGIGALGWYMLSKDKVTDDAEEIK